MNGFGTLHFYTDDYRFNVVWEHPEKIVEHNPCNIVEPNFSLFQDMPIAMGLREVYRKRSIARRMQEQGIGVFVDLNVASKFYKVNMLGVPKGWSSFCTRGYSDRLHYLEFEYNLAAQWAEDNPLLFVVYGGGDKVKAFCKEKGVIYISPMVAVKTRSAKALKSIEQSVSFLAPETDVTKLIAETEKQIMSSQVSSFSKMIE